jgi:LPS export ABC transporter protein LptC
MRNKVLLFALAPLLIPDRSPDVTIQGFHLVQSKLEKRELDLRAKNAEVYRAEEFYVLNLPRSTIRGDAERSFEVDGSRAFYDAQQYRLSIEADARVQTPENLIFRTKSVEYLTKKKLVTGEDEVEVFQNVQGDEKSLFDLKGRGLRIDINTGQYHILSEARAQRVMAPGEIMNIDSKESYFDSNENRLYFLKKVRVVAPKYHATGDLLFLDLTEPSVSKGKAVTPAAPGIERLEIRSKREARADMKDGTVFRAKGLIFELDSKGDVTESHAIGSAFAELPSGAKLKAEELRSIVRDGEPVILLTKTVEIRVDNKIATCERGEYFPDRGDFILEEVASLNDGSQVINGEKIRYSVKEDKVFVERASGTLDREQMNSGNKKKKKEQPLVIVPGT